MSAQYDLEEEEIFDEGAINSAVRPATTADLEYNDGESGERKFHARSEGKHSSRSEANKKKIGSTPAPSFDRQL